MKIVDAKASKRTAVSPVIATLLLIAIAVAAGILVYVFVNGLATNLTGGGGQQVASQLSEDAFSSSLVQANSSYSYVMTLRNVGGSSSTISGVYFDGSALSQRGTASLAMNSQATLTIRLAQTFTSTSAANAVFSGIASSGSPTIAGTSHVVRIILSNGAQFSFTVVAGSTG